MVFTTIHAFFPAKNQTLFNLKKKLFLKGAVLRDQIAKFIHFDESFYFQRIVHSKLEQDLKNV